MKINIVKSSLLASVSLATLLLSGSLAQAQIITTVPSTSTTVLGGTTVVVNSTTTCTTTAASSTAGTATSTSCVTTTATTTSQGGGTGTGTNGFTIDAQGNIYDSTGTLRGTVNGSTAAQNAAANGTATGAAGTYTTDANGNIINTRTGQIAGAAPGSPAQQAQQAQQQQNSPLGMIGQLMQGLQGALGGLLGGGAGGGASRGGGGSSQGGGGNNGSPCANGKCGQPDPNAIPKNGPPSTPEQLLQQNGYAKLPDGTFAKVVSQNGNTVTFSNGVTYDKASKTFTPAAGTAPSNMTLANGDTYPIPPGSSVDNQGNITFPQGKGGISSDGKLFLGSTWDAQQIANVNKQNNGPTYAISSDGKSINLIGDDNTVIGKIPNNKDNLDLLQSNRNGFTEFVSPGTKATTASSIPTDAIDVAKKSGTTSTDQYGTDTTRVEYNNGSFEEIIKDKSGKVTSDTFYNSDGDAISNEKAQPLPTKVVDGTILSGGAEVASNGNTSGATGVDMSKYEGAPAPTPAEANNSVLADPNLIKNTDGTITSGGVNYSIDNNGNAIPTDQYTGSYLGEGYQPLTLSESDYSNLGDIGGAAGVPFIPGYTPAFDSNSIFTDPSMSPTEAGLNAKNAATANGDFGGFLNSDNSFGTAAQGYDWENTAYNNGFNGGGLDTSGSQAVAQASYQIPDNTFFGADTLAQGNASLNTGGAYSGTVSDAGPGSGASDFVQPIITQTSQVWNVSPVNDTGFSLTSAGGSNAFANPYYLAPTPGQTTPSFYNTNESGTGLDYGSTANNYYNSNGYGYSPVNFDGSPDTSFQNNYPQTYTCADGSVIYANQSCPNYSAPAEAGSGFDYSSY